MGTLKLIGIFLLLGICFSCSDNKSTKEQDLQHLEQMFSKIESLASTVNCNDASEWTFTGIGSKGCGGPVTYIAYSTKMDTDLFLRKVKEYTTAQQKFNRKWGVWSTCNIPPPPKEIICKNGNPILKYSNSNWHQ